jgi:hypothetical protein
MQGKVIKCLCQVNFGELNDSEWLGLKILLVVRNSNKLGNTTFRKLDLFPFSGEERERPNLSGFLGPVIEVSSL